ncbi:MAG: type IV pilus assembly protein PilX, partial [Nitrosomonas europaea]
MDSILPSDFGDTKRHPFSVRNGGSIVSRQRGAVLVTGLIFLIILTLMGTTAM